LRDLARSFGAVHAVDGLSLDLAAGECVTLLGPSGSGKSTTLALIAGFLRPERGEILLDNMPLLHTPPHRRGLGLVFQDAQLLPHLTAAENVAFPLSMRDAPRADRVARVRAALDMVRLLHLAGRYSHQLSGGQAQRVALARALVLNPRLVLLDEPFGALDRQLREDMQTEVRALQRRLGFAMLHVTHDQSEALAVADRIGVIDAGRLRQIGTPRALYDAPADAFVARFLGENNRLSGHVEAVEDDIATVRLPGGRFVEARAEGVAAGRRCVVSIRPELIALAPISAEEMGEGALPAVLRDLVFRGDHMRISLDIAGPGGGPMIVKRPAGVPLLGLVPGAEVALAWQSHHARAFPPEVGA
jgi:putative spermidine/putrescine transport system ATP-binding protein